MGRRDPFPEFRPHPRQAQALGLPPPEQSGPRPKKASLGAGLFVKLEPNEEFTKRARERAEADAERGKNNTTVNRFPEIEAKDYDIDLVVYLAVSWEIPLQVTNNNPCVQLPVVQLFRKPLVEVKAMVRSGLVDNGMASLLSSVEFDEGRQLPGEGANGSIPLVKE